MLITGSGPAGTAPMPTHNRASAQTIEPQDFLLPDPVPRRRPPSSPVRAALVEDAVFEVVAAAPRPYRRMNDDNPAKARPSATPSLLPAIARTAGQMAALLERRLATLSPQAFTALLSSLVLVVFWICGGFSALNASASGRPHAPFALVRTSIDTEDANGMKVALVTGAVRNTSDRVIAAPRLAVVTGARQDIIGTVALSVDRIGPGVTIPFSARFKLAGGKSADITIIPEHP